jgi:hypothetical protein
MDPLSVRSRAHRFASWAMAVASVFITSLWVAICAVAPEFIWQGLRTAYEHPDWSDLLSALLIGLILAFFVEPATERVRDLLHLARTKTDFVEGRPRNVFFTACLSLAFALTSVGLHDAMSAFISGHGEGAEGIGIKAGISLTTEWAFVPFAMMLAWQCVRLRWLAVPTGIVALVSAAIAGWLFGWSTKAILDTIIPCAIVLALGYRAVAKPPANRAFVRCARIVAVVGAVWIGAALLIDTVLGFFHLNPFKLYSASDVFADMRFYLGWTLGLLLAPYAGREATGRATRA